VHSDHLNTPRKLSDKKGQPRWQWAYSGFGEIGAQSLTTATLSEVRYNLRYPGQVDDGNGLFYNWHRFYHPGTGRYTQADPIGLEGGWNRFGYAYGNPLLNTDPTGHLVIADDIVIGGAVLGVGCMISSGCREAVANGFRACGRAIDNLIFNNGDKNPSTPTGQRGSPIEVKPGTNQPTAIGGRDYTGHALDRMQGRGVPPSAVEGAINNGLSSPGNQPDTTVHTGPGGLTVVTGSGGQVITVIPR
jgi:RHS repeat-associated protein